MSLLAAQGLASGFGAVGEALAGGPSNAAGRQDVDNNFSTGQFGGESGASMLTLLVIIGGIIVASRL